jgi:hypothetical protein
MTTTDAATDLQVPGADPAPPMTPAAAWAERARLLTDPEWKAAFEKGSAAHRIEMNRVLSQGTSWGIDASIPASAFPSAIAGQIEIQRAEQTKVLREQTVDDLRMRAAIPEPVAEMLRAGTPVTVSEQRLAREERDRLLNDVDFVRRLRAGDSEANQRWTLLQIIRSAPVKAA